MEKFYKMLSALFLLLALTSTTLLAQRTVTGTVLDEYDVGLPGVTVQVKGTTTGTATDADGNFSITVPGNESRLVFSFVGYFTKEEMVGNRNTVNLSLLPDVQTLTEMVVTGYAVQEKRDITGSGRYCKPGRAYCSSCCYGGKPTSGPTGRCECHQLRYAGGSKPGKDQGVWLICC